MENNQCLWLEYVFRDEKGNLLCEYREGESEEVITDRFTKKILTKALATSILNLEEYEALLGVKVENIDDFLKASWLACFLFHAFNIPYFHSTVFDQDADDIDVRTGMIYMDPDLKKARELYEVYGENMKTPDEFYDWCGNERLGNLWETGQDRMGIDISMLFNKDQNGEEITERDLIAITPKYKCAVVGVIMADIMDDAVKVLNGDYDISDIRSNMVLDDFLKLPAE